MIFRNFTILRLALAFVVFYPSLHHSWQYRLHPPMITRSLLLLICLMGGCPPILIGGGIEVGFAGVAFLGDYGDAEELYPFSKAISERRPLDQIAWKTLSGMRNRTFSLNPGLLDIESGESVAMALAIDDEDVYVEEIAGEYKIVLQLSLQLIFFDFREKMLIASYPLRVQYITANGHRPGIQEVFKDFRRFYEDPGFNLNVFSLARDRLKDIQLRKKYNQTLQVREVQVREMARNHLPPVYRENLDGFCGFAAHSLSAALSNTLGVAVLPYSKGHAIGNKMAMRFSDARVLDLRIPEATYGLELTMRGFKQVEHDRNHRGVAMIYGTSVHLHLEEPLLGKTYLDQKFKKGVTKVIPALQENVEQWMPFQNCMLLLFEEIAQSLGDRKAFPEMATVIRNCR